MKSVRLRDQPPLSWVDPSQCVHPAPVALLKFNDDDETLFFCIERGCATTMIGNSKDPSLDSVSGARSSHESVVAEDAIVLRMVHSFDDPYEGGIISKLDYGVEHSMEAVQSVAVKVR